MLCKYAISVSLFNIINEIDDRTCYIGTNCCSFKYIYYYLNNPASPVYIQLNLLTEML